MVWYGIVYYTVLYYTIAGARPRSLTSRGSTRCRPPAHYILLYHKMLYYIVLYYVNGLLCYIILYHIIVSIILYHYLNRLPTAGFQTGSGQMVFSQKGHVSIHFAIFCIKCARVDAFFNMLSHFDHIFPFDHIPVQYGSENSTPYN